MNLLLQAAAGPTLETQQAIHRRAEGRGATIERDAAAACGRQKRLFEVVLPTAARRGGLRSSEAPV